MLSKAQLTHNPVQHAWLAAVDAAYGVNGQQQQSLEMNNHQQQQLEQPRVAPHAPQPQQQQMQCQPEAARPTMQTGEQPQNKGLLSSCFGCGQQQERQPAPAQGPRGAHTTSSTTRGSASKDATRDVFGRSAADVQLGASSLVFAEGVARCVVQGVQPLSAIDHSAILTCINPKALFYEYGLDPAALATSLALTLRDFPTLCGRLATAGSSGSSGASTGSSGSSGARASGGTAGTGLGMRIGGWPSQSQSQPQGGATSAAVAGQQLWQVKTSDDGSSGSSRRSRGGTLLPSRKGKSSVADIRAMGKHRRDMAYRIVLCNAGASVRVASAPSWTLASHFPLAAMGRTGFKYSAADDLSGDSDPCLPPWYEPVDIKDMLRGEEPVLKVRLTQLGCGGSILAITISHVVLDGHSAARFLTAWSDKYRAVRPCPVPSLTGAPVPNHHLPTTNRSAAEPQRVVAGAGGGGGGATATTATTTTKQRPAPAAPAHNITVAAGRPPRPPGLPRPSSPLPPRPVTGPMPGPGMQNAHNPQHLPQANTLPGSLLLLSSMPGDAPASQLSSSQATTASGKPPGQPTLLHVSQAGSPASALPPAVSIHVDATGRVGGLAAAATARPPAATAATAATANAGAGQQLAGAGLEQQPRMGAVAMGAVGAAAPAVPIHTSAPSPRALRPNSQWSRVRQVRVGSSSGSSGSSAAASRGSAAAAAPAGRGQGASTGPVTGAGSSATGSGAGSGILMKGLLRQGEGQKRAGGPFMFTPALSTLSLQALPQPGWGPTFKAMARIVKEGAAEERKWPGMRSNLMSQILFIPDHQVTAIKALATSSLAPSPSPTSHISTNDALTALIWVTLCELRGRPLPGESAPGCEEHALGLAVDLRRNGLAGHLPLSTIANATWALHVPTCAPLPPATAPLGTRAGAPRGAGAAGGAGQAVGRVAAGGVDVGRGVPWSPRAHASVAATAAAAAAAAAPFASTAAPAASPRVPAAVLAPSRAAEAAGVSGHVAGEEEGVGAGDESLLLHGAVTDDVADDHLAAAAVTERLVASCVTAVTAPTMMSSADVSGDVAAAAVTEAAGAVTGGDDVAARSTHKAMPVTPHVTPVSPVTATASGPADCSATAADGCTSEGTADGTAAAGKQQVASGVLSPAGSLTAPRSGGPATPPTPPTHAAAPAPLRHSSKLFRSQSSAAALGGQAVPPTVSLGAWASGTLEGALAALEEEDERDTSGQAGDRSGVQFGAGAGGAGWPRLVASAKLERARSASAARLIKLSQPLCPSLHAAGPSAGSGAAAATAMAVSEVSGGPVAEGVEHPGLGFPGQAGASGVGTAAAAAACLPGRAGGGSSNGEDARRFIAALQQGAARVRAALLEFRSGDPAPAAQKAGQKPTRAVQPHSVASTAAAGGWSSGGGATGAGAGAPVVGATDGTGLAGSQAGSQGGVRQRGWEVIEMAQAMLQAPLSSQLHMAVRVVGGQDAMVSSWQFPYWGVDFGSGGPLRFQGVLHPSPPWSASLMRSHPSHPGVYVSIVTPASAGPALRASRVLAALAPGAEFPQW